MYFASELLSGLFWGQHTVQFGDQMSYLTKFMMSLAHGFQQKRINSLRPPFEQNQCLIWDGPI